MPIGSVEAFDVGIFVRLSWLDVVEFDTVVIASNTVLAARLVFVAKLIPDPCAAQSAGFLR